MIVVFLYLICLTILLGIVYGGRYLYHRWKATNSARIQYKLDLNAQRALREFELAARRVEREHHVARAVRQAHEREYFNRADP